jgi:hypothetical protein
MFGSRNRHAPTEREHPADTNADEACGVWICRGGPHGKPKARAAKKEIEQPQHRQGNPDHTGLVSADQVLTEERSRAERSRKRLDREIPNLAGGTVEDAVERDKGHELAEDRRVAYRFEQNSLDCDAAEKGQHDRTDKGDPIGLAPLHHLPCQKGREHRHLALREIEMIDRLVDHNHRERHAGVDRTGGDARQDLV